ncbi:MAG TPA: glycosyltransferase family 2 protein, partial [Candidatus Methanoperedens sp.]
MTITAVVPAFNEEMSIGNMVLHIRQHANRVIVVDDGSTDRTSKVARLAGAEVIRHLTNMGTGTALKTGLEMARQNGTKIVLTVDVNGQGIPDSIQEIIGLIKNRSYDIVVGSLPGNKISCDREKLIFLNKKKINNPKTGILALSIESLRKINLAHLNGSSVNNILLQAENNNLKVKYLQFSEERDITWLKGRNISVVVPAYNEELLIEETIRGIPEYVKRIYVIDDGSTDRTPDILKGITDTRVVSVRHERNRGVGAAIVTGYKLALEDGVDIVAVMAGDNQMDPEQLPRLLKPIIEGRADYTKGNRLIS